MTSKGSLGDRSAQWLPAAALALALVLGGGGSPAPLPELVLQVLVAALAGVWWWCLGQRVTQTIARPAWLLAALLLVLPVVQLVPLPAALWQALPGRVAARDALDLVGAADHWHALSLAPRRTLAALLAVVPAVLMLFMAASLDRRGRTRLVATLAIGGLATLLLGAAQISGGPDGPLRLYGGGSNFIEGFQANHNSTADILLLAIVAAAAWVSESARGKGGLPNRRGPVLGVMLAITLAFGLGVILTASRMGMALLPVALLAEVRLLRPWLPTSRRALGAGFAGLAAVALVAGLALARNDMLARVGDRLTLAGEVRPDLWADSLYAARAYFPVGVGMGNFVPALLAGERLEVVQATVPNRAHNDYLELLVEAGVPGLAALAAAAAVLALALWRARRDPPAGSAALALFGAAGLLILAIHSLVDYPLRSMSIAMAAAVCAGIILPPRVANARQGQSDRLRDEE